MRVEFSRTPNPFERARLNNIPVLISSSLLRRESARDANIPVLFGLVNDKIVDEIIDAVNKAEETTQKRIIEENGIHHAIFPPFRSKLSPPVILELATDKAEAAMRVIAGKIKEREEKVAKLVKDYGRSINYTKEEIKASIAATYAEYGYLPEAIAAVDSAWAIDLTPDNPDDLNHEAVIIQKPKDEEGIGKIINELQIASQNGGRLQSVSGICIAQIGSDGNIYYKHAFAVVDYGRINPDFDWDKLANLMRENGNFAGGLSTVDLFRNFRDLFIPDSDGMAKLTIISEREFKGNKRVSSWEKFSRNQQQFELSIDETNIETLISLSVGLVPQT